MSKPTEPAKEKLLYALFLQGNPPQIFQSSKDLVACYYEQLLSRKKTGDWTEPFLIHDDETGRLVACYSWGTIIGIVQGASEPGNGTKGDSLP